MSPCGTKRFPLRPSNRAVYCFGSVGWHLAAFAAEPDRVSYLVHQQPLLYTLLQLLGGSYLLYLGIGALRAVLSHKAACNGEPTRAAATLQLNNQRQAFLKGFATNILNPKALVFLSAYSPA